MLLTKKLIHLIKFLNKKENQINFTFLYSLITTKYLLISIGSLSNFHQDSIRSIKPAYKYKLKIFTLDRESFNTSVIELMTLLNLVSFKFDFNINNLKSQFRYYTLLRSPFVYKKSREQLMFKKESGLFFLTLKKNNIFLTEYFDYFLKNNILNLKSLKIFITRIAYLK